MFGMGFGEILLIAIVAVVFLGPEKLPNAMVQIAKFFKTFKKGVTEAKQTIEHELKLHELKEDALEYKKKIETSANEIKENTIPNLTELNKGVDLELDTKVK